ncbi:MAG: dihydroneopterin aldolase [Ferruginibacter sp.]|nr:dihydroneopterin aldolase [Ferruginibacter sp.]
MITIHLNKLAFFAHHGLHDEEAITGTNFEVTVSISFEPVAKITSIQHTINYVDVYKVIEKHMVHPVALLEMLAQNISEEIALLDDRIKNINIGINKIHPPVRNFIGQVGVTFQKAF